MGIENLIYQFESFMLNNETAVILGLMFFIIFTLTLTVLNKTVFRKKGEGIIALVIALAVSLIGTYFLNDPQYLTIIKSYNLMAYFLLFILPFLIIIFFAHTTNMGSTLRRIIILIYGVMFYSISDKQDYFNPTQMWITIAFIIGIVIFDKGVHRSIKRGRI